MGFFDSNSSSTTNEVVDSYNTSVTQSFSAGGFSISGNRGNTAIRDISLISDAFKSQDTSSFVANLGAGGTASASLSPTMGGSGLDISKWIPWILGGIAVFLLIKSIRK